MTTQTWDAIQDLREAADRIREQHNRNKTDLTQSEVYEGESSLCCEAEMTESGQCLNCGADGNEYIIPAHVHGGQVIEEQVIRRKRVRDEYDENLE